MSACMARSRSSRRASSRASRRASSSRLSLKIRVITIVTLPTLSRTIETANDAPEMSAAIPTGFCGSQSSPYQKATTEQIIKVETNRPQNAPPIELTFSRMEVPIEPPIVRNHLIDFHPHRSTTRLLQACWNWLSLDNSMIGVYPMPVKRVDSTRPLTAQQMRLCFFLQVSDGKIPVVMQYIHNKLYKPGQE